MSPYFLGCKCCHHETTSVKVTHRLFAPDGTRLLRRDHGGDLLDVAIDDSQNVFIAGYYSDAGQYPGAASLRKLSKVGNQLASNDDFTNRINKIIVADSKVYTSTIIKREDTSDGYYLIHDSIDIPTGLSLTTPPAGYYRCLYLKFWITRESGAPLSSIPYGELCMMLVEVTPTGSKLSFANVAVSDMTASTIQTKLSALVSNGQIVRVQGGPLPGEILVEFFQPNAHPVLSGWATSAQMSTARMPGNTHIASYDNSLSRRWFGSIDAYIPSPLAYAYPQYAHTIGALSDGRIATLWNMGNYEGGINNTKLNLGYFYTPDGFVSKECYSRDDVIPAPYEPTTPMPAGCIAADGYLYLAGGNWKLQKLSTAGAVVWQSGSIDVSTPSEWTRDFMSVAYGDGHVFVSYSTGHKIAKFNASTGAEITTGGWPYTYGESASCRKLLFHDGALWAVGTGVFEKGSDDIFSLDPADASIILQARYHGTSSFSFTNSDCNSIAFNPDGSFWAVGNRTIDT